MMANVSQTGLCSGIVLENLKSNAFVDLITDTTALHCLSNALNGTPSPESRRTILPLIPGKAHRKERIS